MAIKIVNAKTMARYDSNRVRVQAGKNENPIAMALNPTATPATGVRKPAKSRALNATPPKPTNHVADVGLDSHR